MFYFREYKTKEEKLNLEISSLKLSLSKTREDDNKEETDLKRKKQAADQYYAENVNQYDQIMEEWRKNKKQMQDELNKIQDELKNKREYFITLEQKKLREFEVEEEFKKKQKVTWANAGPPTLARLKEGIRTKSRASLDQFQM